MTEAEALRAIQGLAAAHRIVVTAHAEERLRSRHVSPRDLRCALVGARSALWQADRATWRTSGPDEDGDELTVVLVIEGDLVIVTVF